MMKGFSDRPAPYKQAKHQNGAPLALFQLVQMAVKVGDLMNALASFG
jgi:hypothetical protein